MSLYSDKTWSIHIVIIYEFIKMSSELLQISEDLDEAVRKVYV